MNFGDQRLPDRFWSKVSPCPMSGCWLWTAAISWGYGAYGIGKSVHRSHRVTYEALVGPVGDSLDLDHLCRVRSCCNPLHLEPVSRRLNLIRGKAATVKSCPKGHAYDEANTAMWKNRHGNLSRYCRACGRANNAAWHERRRKKDA